MFSLSPSAALRTFILSSICLVEMMAAEPDRPRELYLGVIKAVRLNWRLCGCQSFTNSKTFLSPNKAIEE